LDNLWFFIDLQISKDVLLLMPTLSTHFRSQSTDLESSIPVTQNEAARREIQVFILVRSLYKQILALHESNPSEAAVKVSMDDVTMRAIDDSLIGLTDRGLIPAHFQNGEARRML
jgi:hypothetical protein